MKETLLDRGESTSEMEPLFLSSDSRHREKLADLALELTAAAASFRSSLREGIVESLSGLVRSMNCYYSNLIEGHNTHPVDIEKAMNEDYSKDERKRNLQLEARAHISVQKWIDEGNVAGSANTIEMIQEVHRRFYSELPAEFKSVKDPHTGELTRVQPGEFRAIDVKVGRHIPISPGAVPRFMERFENELARQGKSESILNSAAAHHRLAWIHPFMDGNGRVVRFVSYATLLDNLDSGGVWSIARGLARKVDDYKNHLEACDNQRRNDMDGRGNLSEEALAKFTEFFLNTCIDQVEYMEKLVRPENLSSQALNWVDMEIRTGNLSPECRQILEAILYRGELARSEIVNIVGSSERSGRRFVKQLVDVGAVVSDTHKAPLRLGLPATLAPIWMPGLFPKM